jgi:presenilin-like A22 family membrane protease
MKKNLKITAILLMMFLVTQFIGLYVVNHYSSIKVVDGKQTNVSSPDLPLGLEPPAITSEKDYTNFFYSILFAFVLAVSLFFLLRKFNVGFVIKLWFFIVVVIALTVSISSFFPEFNYKIFLILIFALFLTYLKIYKRNIIIHNSTELLIYPGIAAVFVPIINLFWIIVILILISIYDMWAVWHSGIMQKMAKYQINTLNLFPGFFIPYVSKRTKERLMKLSKSKLKNKKVKANVAILGGGDIVFPIITAGVMLKTLGLIPALFVIFGAALGLTYLFFFAEKKKFYPAMPFITAGIFLAMILSWIIL